MTNSSTALSAKRQPCDPVEFYEANAELLAARYEALSFEDVHREIISYLPTLPATILDVGAGSGRDAAALSKRGFKVVAVEPSSALRHIGQEQHPSPNIIWVEDRLPNLERVAELSLRFDAILCSAVWMHLVRQEKIAAMRCLSELLIHNGRLFLTFRSRSLNDRPGIYATDPDQVIADAKAAGFRLLVRETSSDPFGRPGVRWNRLSFEKSA